MTDKYMKRLLTIIAVALSVLAIQSLSSRDFRVQAQSKNLRRCLWTYVHDTGRPNVGQDGTVEFNKNGVWKRMSDEGWELKAVNKESDYIFERCE